MAPGSTLNTECGDIGKSHAEPASVTVDDAVWSIPGWSLDVGTTVDVNGTSTLTIQNEGQVFSSQRTAVGYSGGSGTGNGAVIVKGVGSLLESGTLSIGVGYGTPVEWGTGTVEILNGGTVRTTADSNTSLTVGGYGIGYFLSWMVRAQRWILRTIIQLGGYNSGVAGTGHLTVQNNASLITRTDDPYRGNLQMISRTGSTFNVSAGGGCHVTRS